MRINKIIEEISVYRIRRQLTVNNHSSGRIDGDRGVTGGLRITNMSPVQF